jgi:hypothetical protein
MWFTAHSLYRWQMIYRCILRSAPIKKEFHTPDGVMHLRDISKEDKVSNYDDRLLIGRVELCEMAVPVSVIKLGFDSSLSMKKSEENETGMLRKPHEAVRATQWQIGY